MSSNPLISFCLLSYNQEEYIEEAIMGAFLQTYSPLEIIISDDCSTDRTVEIITKVVRNYKGEHLVKVNFNQHNQGLVTHFNNVIFNKAKGDFIVIAAGDDISFSNRTEVSYNFIKDKKDTFIADFEVQQIDNAGVEIKRSSSERKTSYGNLEDFIRGKKIKSSGCSRIYRRELFEIFRPLNNNCPTEDSTSVLRALLIGKLWFSSTKVIQYRIHESSISAPNNILKLNLNLIFKQYINDIYRAKSMGFISFNQMFKLFYKLSRLYYKRVRKNVLLRKKLNL
ncbi:glycosyltransferase [Gillisia limnaea]|uniref:Glycosyl transferase family 2 n=1 Tax=Gillisia limnaea (strain DSM 15749 / LMG 21470 / R-8282) TaxID=865937 RepID=H2BS88_GILLR|nr:glycosyltransferase [Gillisia limnaea]EHQ01411.1 glycosyl transferase family 2 [Gillisia limnaea DSM 15749]